MTNPNGEGDPRISVIIPAYNATGVIGGALNALRRQTCTDFETIVVDDGSTDSLSAVVGRYLPSARIYGQENAGAPAARNHGAAEARGRYLTFLDSDDSVTDNWIESLGAAVESSPAVIFCGVKVTHVDSGQEFIYLPKPLGPAFHDFVGLFLPATYAVRRDVFVDVGGFVPGLPYGEHDEFGLRVTALLQEREESTIDLQLALALKQHDRSPARRCEYDHAKRVGAMYKLERHAGQLLRDPRLAADYHAVAGVAAARLDDYAAARRQFVSAVKLTPGTSKHYGRLFLAVFPALGRRYWWRKGR